LVLNGQSAFVQTALENSIREKTLEVWLMLANHSQRGGGAITLEAEDGRVFDSVVLGERELGKWMAGSDFFRRTQPAGGGVETARSEERRVGKECRCWWWRCKEREKREDRTQ